MTELSLFGGLVHTLEGPIGRFERIVPRWTL